MSGIRTVTVQVALLWLVGIPAAVDASPPALVENGGQAAIVWQGDKIAELQGYQRLRFRSNGFNSRWIGARISKPNLCWSYADVNDYVLRGKSFRSTEDSFLLEIEAEKPSIEGRVLTRLEGSDSR